MSRSNIPDEQMKKLLERAGVDPATSAVSRRRWPRHEAEGDVRFHRPSEKTVHLGQLVDVSDGGLAFLTTASLAVGESLLLRFQEEGKEKSAEASVETIHAHPKDDRFLVGAKFVR